MKTRLYHAMELLFYVLLSTAQVSGSSLSNGHASEPGTLPTGITSGTHNAGGQAASSTSACSVEITGVTVNDCEGEVIDYTIHFESQDFGANGYYVKIDDFTYGPFTSLGSLEWGDIAYCAEPTTFIIIDADNETCRDTFVWETECCPCVIDFEVLDIVCNNGLADVYFNMYISEGSCLPHWNELTFTVNGIPYEFEYQNTGFLYLARNVQSVENVNVYRINSPYPAGTFAEDTRENLCPSTCSIGFFEVIDNDLPCEGEFKRLPFIIEAIFFGNEGFTITSNYGDVFEFELGDQYYIDIVADCNQEYIFFLTDNLNQDCTAEYVYGAVCCDCAGTYSILEEAPCVNGSFDAVHEFVYLNGSCFDSDWTLTINDSIYPFTWLNDEYFRIDDISFPDSVLTYEFCATSPVEACFSFEATNPCYHSQNDCSMVFEEIGNPVCANDSLFMSLLIVGQNLSFQGFDVHINDSLLTWLNYEQDSIYELNFPDPGNQVFTLTICNNLNPDCCYEKVFENPCYVPDNDCFLTFEPILPSACANDSITMSVQITGQNLSQTGFDVFLNDTFVVFMPYDADSIYTLLLPDPGTQNFILTICDTNQAGCCNEREFINPCNNTSDSCSLVFEEIGNAVCDSNFFNLSMIIAGTDISQTGFDVYLNGTILTFLLYQQDSTYQFVVPDPGTPWYHLTICDNDNELCCYTKELPNPCYEPNIDCSLVFETMTDPVCNQDSVVFSLFITGQNLSQTRFDVYTDGTLTTFLPFEEDSLYVLKLPDTGSDSLDITICDNNHPGCCFVRTYANPCYDPPGPCGISWEESGAPTCANGLISLSIDVQGQNTSNTGYDVFVNDSLLVFLPDTAGSTHGITFPDMFTDEISIIICDHENAACCQGRLIENPCFTQGLCIVNNFSASAVKTTGDSLLVSGRFDQTDDCPANIPAVFTLNGGDSLLTDCTDGFFQFTHPGVETDSIYLEACLRLEFDTCLQIILPNPLISDLKTNTENALIFRQSTEEIMIVNPGKLFYEWQLFDIASGRILGNFSNQNENIISIQNLPSGLYFIVLKQDQQVYVHKILHITK